MFISFEHNNSRSAFYECSSYKTRMPIGDNNTVFFDLERKDAVDIHLDIKKDSGTEVYVLNNEGKTIDSYRYK
ncbi:MAG: hypothetical protein ACOC5T_09565 [Elusimicrobiota bacterium]